MDGKHADLNKEDKQMLNHINENSTLFIEFTKWLETAHKGCYCMMEDDAVDTTESIENFFEGRDVKIFEDVTENGIRRVDALTSNPDKSLKNTIKQFLMMSDGVHTLVLVD